MGPRIHPFVHAKMVATSWNSFSWRVESCIWWLSSWSRVVAPSVQIAKTLGCELASTASKLKNLKMIKMHFFANVILWFCSPIVFKSAKMETSVRRIMACCPQTRLPLLQCCSVAWCWWASIQTVHSVWRWSNTPAPWQQSGRCMVLTCGM